MSLAENRRWFQASLLPLTHECSSTWVSRKLKANDVIDVLSDLFIMRCVPEHIRSYNGPELIAAAVQRWVEAVGAKHARIAFSSLWEDIYIQGFETQYLDEPRQHFQLFVEERNYE